MRLRRRMTALPVAAAVVAAVTLIAACSSSNSSSSSSGTGTGTANSTASAASGTTTIGVDLTYNYTAFWAAYINYETQYAAQLHIKLLGPLLAGGQRQPAEHADRGPGQRGREGHHREPRDRDQPRPGDHLRGASTTCSSSPSTRSSASARSTWWSAPPTRCTAGRLRLHQHQGQVRLRAGPGGRPDLIQRRRPDQRVRPVHDRQRPRRAHPQGPHGLDRSHGRHRRAERGERLRQSN